MPEHGARSCPHTPGHRLRRAVSAATVLTVLTGCACACAAGQSTSAPGSAVLPASVAPPATGGPPHREPGQSPSGPPPIPSPAPGPARVVSSAPAGADRRIALTVDDGFCEECVAGYVTRAERGLHLTFCPNGTYGAVWETYAERIRALVALGRVRICNHTYSHQNLTELADEEVVREIQRNEEWIERTFGVSARPWLRPPFGAHDERVDAIAGQLGFTRILMWNGSFGDSGRLDPQVLLGEASTYLRPGTIILAHANHPVAVRHFDRIQAMIDERGLRPVTVDEMFAP